MERAPVSTVYDNGLKSSSLMRRLFRDCWEVFSMENPRESCQYLLLCSIM